MLITFQVDTFCDPLGVKESLAMLLEERFGDIRLVCVQEPKPEQIKLDGVS